MAVRPVGMEGATLSGWYSSAPISYALPVGRASPSMSVVRSVIVTPASTTPGTLRARCKSPVAGAMNQAACAVVWLVAGVTAAPPSEAMDLFVRLLRI